MIEWGDRVLPIVVKGRRRVQTEDVCHLRTFLEEYADLAPAGVVLHDGEETFWIRENVLAVPWRRVL